MLIHVKIIPNSKHDEIIEKNSTSFVVHVREPAERNLANGKMISLLAKHFKVETNKIHIITGHHMPGKIVEVVTEPDTSAS